MTQPKTPASLPEDEEMDPVGLPYPEQEPLAPITPVAPATPGTPDDGDDPPHPPFSPDREPDIAPE